MAILSFGIQRRRPHVANKTNAKDIEDVLECRANSRRTATIYDAPIRVALIVPPHAF